MREGALLGAGSALPSLLLSTLQEPPGLIVVTDYPDEGIQGNLKRNVERNKLLVALGCKVNCAGYDWGKDPSEILSFLPPKEVEDSPGYDVLILSDLLHFFTSHDALISSIEMLLAKKRTSRVYVGAGTYTHADVCDNFLRKGKEIGLVLEEIVEDPLQKGWLGTSEVSNLDKEALGLRKAACRYWIGWWSPRILSEEA